MLAKFSIEVCLYIAGLKNLVRRLLVKMSQCEQPDNSNAAALTCHVNYLLALSVSTSRYSFSGAKKEGNFLFYYYTPL